MLKHQLRSFSLTFLLALWGSVAVAGREALVIIDMQEVFDASKDPDVLAVASEEIRKAKEKSDRIIFVEWNARGPTHECLTKLVDEDDDIKVVKKRVNDGSRHVDAVLNDIYDDLEAVKICGVNTDMCVLWTLSGLTRMLPKHIQIKVLADACGTAQQRKQVYSRWNTHLWALDEMKRFPRVEVVSDCDLSCWIDLSKMPTPYPEQLRRAFSH